MDIKISNIQITHVSISLNRPYFKLLDLFSKLARLHIEVTRCGTSCMLRQSAPAQQNFFLKW